MNISPDGYTVRFKTEQKELFEAEKSGVKSNTVRILDYYEYKQLKKRNPKMIIIQRQQEIFLRAITHMHFTEIIFGKVIVVISWARLKTHHQRTDEEPPLDVQAINISLGLLEKLDACRGVESYDVFIASLLEPFICASIIQAIGEEEIKDER